MRCQSSQLKSGAWWCVRWLVLIVLALDMLSAPLHQHRHEGVGWSLDFAASHASPDQGESRADGHDHLLQSHVATAIRIDLSRLGKLPPADNIRASLALVSLSQLLAAPGDAQPNDRRPDRSSLDFRSHDSLPPASRAPPLHT